MADNDKPEDHAVNEPAADYSVPKKKRIRFFKSFEEAEEADLIERLKLTPEERIASVTRRLEEMYAEELSKRKKPTRIFIRH